MEPWGLFDSRKYARYSTGFSGRSRTSACRPCMSVGTTLASCKAQICELKHLFEIGPRHADANKRQQPTRYCRIGADWMLSFLCTFSAACSVAFTCMEQTMACTALWVNHCPQMLHELHANSACKRTASGVTIAGPAGAVPSAAAGASSCCMGVGCSASADMVACAHAACTQHNEHWPSLRTAASAGAQIENAIHLCLVNRAWCQRTCKLSGARWP